MLRITHRPTWGIPKAAVTVRQFVILHLMVSGNIGYVKLRALRSYVSLSFTCLRAYLLVYPMCLRAPVSHVPTCLYTLSLHVLSCLCI